MLPHEMLQNQTQVERSLLSRTMGWLALSLALTAGGVYAYYAGVAPSLNPFIYFLIAIGLIFGSRAAARRNQTLAAVFLAGFSVVEGLFVRPGLWSCPSEAAR